MKESICTISILFLLLLSGCNQTEESDVRNGVLDLREGWRGVPVALSGYWMFRSPGSGDDSDSGFIKVPGSWEEAKGESRGTGIYELRILAEKSQTGLWALYMTHYSQLMEISANGKIVHRVGDWRRGLVDSSRGVAVFSLEEDTILRIRMRNTEFRTGGLHHSPVLGPRHIISRNRILNILWDGLQAGFLLFIVIYHLFLWFNRYGSRTALFLALGSFFILIRSLVVGEDLLLMLLPRMSWYTDYVLEYVSIYGNASVLTLYIFYIFPISGKIFRNAIFGFAGLGVVFMVVTALLPISVISLSIYVMQFYLLIMILFSMGMCIYGVRSRRRGAVLFLFATIILTTFSFLDILYYLGFISVYNLSQIGMIVFVMIQTLVLSRYYGYAHVQAVQHEDTLEKEVGLRTRELERVNESLKREIDVRVEIEKQLHKQTMTDVLTGLPNRLKLAEDLDYVHRRFLRYGTPFCLAMVDLDHFKRVNDQFGHDTGDLALKFFAKTAQSAIRDVDFLGRWGGEEFLLILPEVSLPFSASVAERIRKAIEKGEEGLPGITVSIGVVELKDPGESLDSLIHRADQMMYKAKHKGRNRVEH